jgi:DNA-binding transcriptional LysR family regulator
MGAVKADRGLFRVGYNSALLAEFMPECLMTYAAKCPRVHVELVDLNSAEQITAVWKGEIHLAFVAPQKDWKLPPGLASAPVFSAKMQAVVERGHRLASGSAVPLAELSAERSLAISGPPWHIHRDDILTMFKSHGLPPPNVVEVVRLDALLALVAGGEGVTMLIWRRCMAFPNQIVLSLLRETGRNLELNIRAIWRKSTNSIVTQGFITTLRTNASRDRLKAVAHDKTTFS